MGFLMLCLSANFLSIFVMVLKNSPFANSPVFSKAKVGSSHLIQQIGFLNKASWLLAGGLCQSFIHGNVLL